jgi:plastocyanin
MDRLFVSGGARETMSTSLTAIIGGALLALAIGLVGAPACSSSNETTDGGAAGTGGATGTGGLTGSSAGSGAGTAGAGGGSGGDGGSSAGSGAGTTGSSGSNPGTAGAAGMAGGGTGGSGGDPNFMSLIPCLTEASYTTTGTTIAFGGTTPGFHYDPACLRVSAGTTVTFNGDFAVDPLSTSTMRGTTLGSPITATDTGTTKSFTLPNAGFYAYYSASHGSDIAAYMNGVIWVK